MTATNVNAIYAKRAHTHTQIHDNGIDDDVADGRDDDDDDDHDGQTRLLGGGWRPKALGCY